jgi:two-component system chemotaxis response regulator CheY
MVIEDTVTFRRILQHQLIGLGVSSIFMAADGAEALVMLGHDADFDLIICDWHMEPMDGLEFCAKVQETPELKGRNIPVLFMTADVKMIDPVKQERLKATMKALGIVGVLPKPFNSDELKQVLASCGADQAQR